MNTINISRLEKTLSEILSDRHNKEIIVMLEGNDEIISEDYHSDSRIDDYGRRLRTG